jgi:hypothetical protein
MRRRAKAYLDGFGAVRSVIGLDELTARVVLESVCADREQDPALTPWRRGPRTAIRTALGS